MIENNSVQLLNDLFPERYRCDNLSCQAQKRPRLISSIVVNSKTLHSFIHDAVSPVSLAAGLLVKNSSRGFVITEKKLPFRSSRQYTTSRGKSYFHNV